MAANTKYNSAIQYALRLAKATLNKYYSLHQESDEDLIMNYVTQENTLLVKLAFLCKIYLT